MANIIDTHKQMQAICLKVIPLHHHIMDQSSFRLNRVNNRFKRNLLMN